MPQQTSETMPNIGAVAYAKSNMMFIARASTGNEASTHSTEGCVEFSNKNRWAFLIVDYEGSTALRAETTNEEAILKKLQDNYAGYIDNAIEGAGVKRKEDIQNFSSKQGKHTVYSKSAICVINPSLKSLLDSFNMRFQAGTLNDEQKQDGPLHTRMVLPLDVKECNEYLAKEQYEELSKLSARRRSRIHPKKHHAYAVVAWAYSYKEDKDGNLTLVKAKEAQVGFVPRARVECGLFFDGTNNNKFNTKMREEYEAFLDTKKRIIESENFSPNSWESQVRDTKIPKSKVLPLIYKDLSTNISSYTKAEKEDGYESSWYWMFRNKASDDSEKIYDYFNEDTDEEVAKFVEDKLLPSGADSSYTGGNTNVVKLHKLYKTETNDISHKEHLYECYRDKIYVTGAGTYDYRRQGEHEEDEVLLGSALAMYSTGVTSKVNQACKSLAQKLDALPVGFIDTLVLDVFGFSRGAAEARHFVGSIIKVDFDIATKEYADKDGKSYHEYILSKNGENLYPYLIREREERKDDVVIDKIVFRFVGIFDTVPHYGLRQDNDAKDLNLKLEASKISRVVHLTAKNEYRHNFDLFSIKSSEDASLEDNFEEKSLFGAHSDIGGGYIDGKAETVELPMQVKMGITSENDESIKRVIEKWNKKYFWVKTPCVISITDTVGEKDGFYIQKHTVNDDDNDSLGDYTLYKIFMHRNHIDNEYAQVSLEYMHKKAVSLIPLDKKLPPLTYKDMQPFTKASGNKLTWATETMTEDDFNPYKPQFVHHSSSAGIAHASNMGSDHGLYGKRKVHYV